jgi:hypothetical protein
MAARHLRPSCRSQRDLSIDAEGAAATLGQDECQQADAIGKAAV